MILKCYCFYKENLQVPLVTTVVGIRDEPLFEDAVVDCSSLTVVHGPSVED